MKLENWLQKNKPHTQKNKFEKYKKEIEELTKEGYSQNQIIDFLRGNGLKCNQSELCKYLNRRKGGKQNVQKLTPPTPKGEEIKQQHNTTTKSVEIPKGYLPRIPFQEGDKWFMYLENGEKRRCTSTGVLHNPDPNAAKDLY